MDVNPYNHNLSVNKLISWSEEKRTEQKRKEKKKEKRKTEQSKAWLASNMITSP